LTLRWASSPAAFFSSPAADFFFFACGRLFKNLNDHAIYEK